MFSWARATGLGCALALIAMCVAAAAAEEDSRSEELVFRELSGKVGPYPIGMQFKVLDNTPLADAHYFYVRQLVDIPLKVRLDGETMTLQGADGSMFRLHFVTSHPTHGAPLTVQNAEGFAGVWTKGGTSLPVALQFEWSWTARQATGSQARLYDSVTDLSDAEYEAKVRKFLQAAIKGDRDTAAAFVSYPLYVNGPGTRRRVIRNKAALLAQWKRIFTPSLLRILKDVSPHEMFTRSGQVSVGLGDVWFDDKGAVAINLR